MKKFYKERFEAQRRIARKLASTVEVNTILEVLRDELRDLVPGSMECCILLLDPDASRYTRPLQCALFDRPVNCLSCKRNRAAVRKAMDRQKAVVVSETGSVTRRDGSVVETGPEGAVPVLVDGQILAVVTVVVKPGSRLARRDLFFSQDVAETVGNNILHAKRHWALMQEKISVSRQLASLSPFVPQSVRRMLERNPEGLDQAKEKRNVTVLFLDLEDYTRLTTRLTEDEMNGIVERMFSRFVDPIQRSRGEINETTGDGLMILFKEDDPKTNAMNAARAALEIRDQVGQLNLELPRELGPLHVNMGLNSGSALVGMSRFRGALAVRMTYTASGQVTNVAARLADLARGGEILVGEETGRMIEGLWQVASKGRIQLKGIADPLEVYELKPLEIRTELV